MKRRYNLKGALVLCLAFCLSCEKTIIYRETEDKKEESSEYTMPIMDTYCALGASTASMDWQRKVGQSLARDYRCYALGGTRWIHTGDSAADLTADASGGGDNRVMTNQLLRLLEDKKTGYSPDMITVLCGLNDAAYSTLRPVLGSYEEAFATDLSGVTPQQWFDDPAYKELRETVYGSLRFFLQTLIREFPYANIVVITPQQVNNGTYTYERIEPICRALREVCRRYSVPVIDMFWESGVSDMGNLNELYVGSDRIHPNAQGEYLLYVYLEKRLRQMYLPKKLS